MRKRKTGMIVLAIAFCTAMLSIWGSKTYAAPTLNSQGEFVSDDGEMAFYETDLIYLDGELDSLENEVDHTIFDEADRRKVSDPRQNELQSKGIIDYDNGKVVISSLDLFSMADGIDDLESDYVDSAVSALGRIGTYLNESGNVSHTATFSDPTVLFSGDQIKEGIHQSQSIDHLVDTTPIIIDNLTAGTAAWVNGECIIGNGADNERAYKKGIKDGKAGTDEDIEVEYTYHTHVNRLGKKVTATTVYTLTNPGGCYKASGHTHNVAGSSCTYHDECHCQFETPGDPSSGCAKHDHNTWWSCDNNPTNTFMIGCGKKAGQIETATVIINRNDVKEREDE